MRPLFYRGRHPQRGRRSARGGTIRSEYGYHKLQELKEKDTSTILLALTSTQNGLTGQFSNPTLSKDWVDTLVFLISQALQCRTAPATRIQLLRALYSSTFLKSRLAERLTELAFGCQNNRDIQQILHGSFQIFKVMFEVMPSALVSTYQVLLMLQKAGPKMDVQVQMDLKRLCERVENKFSSKEEKAFERHNAQDFEIPPGDFHDMEIFPTMDDLNQDERPFLRVNKTKGTYQDLGHYLDVQFRLLREDLVQPLRQGIEWYRNNKGVNKCQSQNIRIYKDVQILCPRCFREGIGYVVRFNTKELGQVDWELSKRLLYGSLVCLSSDDFETVMFATVIDRTVDSLKEGEIHLRFQETQEYGLLLEPGKVFVMIETEAYFEAYRHVLKGLQNIEADDLPFQRYIVHCDTEVKPVPYLKGRNFDFSCLIEGNKRGSTAVEVLKKHQWPKAKALQVDKAQYAALQAALTQEMSIIQGPPGTGKTYLGLKIVQLLLQNKRIWQDEDGIRPLLVVCYTNHALDQFLEGIHSFMDTGIVRVGGRSKSEDLATCTLKYKRQYTKSSHEVVDATTQAKSDLYKCKDELEAVMAHLAVANTGVLKTVIVTQFMSEEQEASLYQLEGQDDIRGGIVHGWLTGMDMTHHVEEEEEEQEEEPQMKEDVENTRHQLDEDAQDSKTEREKWEACVKRAKATDLMETHVRHMKQIDGDGFVKQRQERKKEKRLMKHHLQQTSLMPQEFADSVTDIWVLPVDARWQLYRFWIGKYKQQLVDRILQKMEAYEETAERLKEAKQVEDLEIMRRATVLGMTTTGAARYQRINQALRPRIIVVEEAAEVLEGHIITTLSAGCDHLILIGDHKQLRPSPAVYELAKKFHLDCSLFERMVNNGIPCVCLQTQHRMRPEVSVLMKPIYPELQDDVSVTKYENIRGVQKNMFFVNHASAETHSEETKSKSNKHEALYVVALARYLCQQGYDPSQLTILTTYTGQYRMVTKMLQKSHVKPRVCVVDNYQGEENDIILLSLVRSNPEGRVGFLNVANRVCVALSRAKKGFFVIGNLTLLASVVPLWQKLKMILDRQNSVDVSLPLYCQNHPKNEGIEAQSAKDFEKVPEGGCLIPCEFRLKCGHVCELVCHPYDPKHKEYMCQKTCEKVVCDKGHKCQKKCHMKCGPCRTVVQIEMPICHHMQHVPCHQDPERWRCTYHSSYVCLCGKTKLVPCGINPKDVLCQRKCKALLECGHPCPGRCGLCRMGRLHVACNCPCGRRLVCGHFCTEPCTDFCPPCTVRCENRCAHSACPLECGQACTSCREPCTWFCRHSTCTNLCSEPCNRLPCSRPCMEMIGCGHPCIGLCGEPCPTLCRICDKDQVTEILFGEEDDPSARFVQLQDCRHVIEYTALDRYMGITSEQDERYQGGTVNIQLKKCPKCTTPIRRCNRYGNIINNRLQDMEAVKKRLRSSTEHIQLESDTMQVIGNLKVFDRVAAMQLERKLAECNTTHNVVNVSHQARFMTAIARLQTEVGSSTKEAGSEQVLNIELEVRQLREWVLIQNRISVQQTKECAQEISRIDLVIRLLTMVTNMKEYLTENPTHEQCVVFLPAAEKALSELGKMKTSLTEATEKAFRDLCKKVGILEGYYVLKIAVQMKYRNSSVNKIIV